MEVILDPKKLLAGIRKTCDDLQQAFDIIEDHEEDLRKLAGLAEEDVAGGEDVRRPKESAIDVLLDAMPEVLPGHKATIREAFQLVEDERDLALARASKPWMMKEDFDKLSQFNQALFIEKGGRVIEF